MKYEWSKLEDTCKILSAASQYYAGDNKIDFNDGMVVFEDGLDGFGICVEKGIEKLAATLQEPLEFRVKKYQDGDYLIEKKFFYKGACYYQHEYVDEDKVKDGVIYDNTTHTFDSCRE